MPYALQAPVHSELVIKKSRFIGCVEAVPDRAAALARVAALWAEHPSATHVCWALMAGGQSAAYTDSVAQALLKAEKVPVIRHTVLRCVLPYALEGWLRRELETHGASLLEAARGEGVTVALQLPEANAAALVVRLNDVGQGKVVWVTTEENG